MTMPLPTVTENLTVLSSNVRLAISDVPDAPVNLPDSLPSFSENSKTNSRAPSSALTSRPPPAYARQLRQDTAEELLAASQAFPEFVGVGVVEFRPDLLELLIQQAHQEVFFRVAQRDVHGPLPS